MACSQKILDEWFEEFMMGKWGLPVGKYQKRLLEEMPELAEFDGIIRPSYELQVPRSKELGKWIKGNE